MLSLKQAAKEKEETVDPTSFAADQKKPEESSGSYHAIISKMRCEPGFKAFMPSPPH